MILTAPPFPPHQITRRDYRSRVSSYHVAERQARSETDLQYHTEWSGSPDPEQSSAKVDVYDGAMYSYWCMRERKVW